MTFVLLLPAALSSLMLGAHFLRVGHYAFVLLALAIIPLLFVRRPWAARIVQVAMVLGMAIWVQTTIQLIHARMVNGEPFYRMAAILGAVAAVAGLSAVLIQSKRLQRYFGLSAMETK
ncbi:MAG: hypothetical protein ACYDBB_26885 [Armatimonadota bacterium]